MAHESYQDYLVRAKHKHGDRFSDKSLAPQFIRYFETGQRIEVTTTYEGGSTFVRRGTVGVTNGWIPTFILMSRSSAYGSSDVLGESDKVTGVIGNHSKRYPPVARYVI